LDFLSWSEKYSNFGKIKKGGELMFLRGFGQYEEGDIPVTPDYSISPATGITEAQLATLPIADVSIPSTQPTGGGFLSSIGSLLSSVVGGAAQVGSAYLSSQKPTGAVLVGAGGAARPAALQAGIISPSSLGSSLPILGIIGIGAFLILRGRKKGRR
jgi:hypothetical protein